MDRSGDNDHSNSPAHDDGVADDVTPQSTDDGVADDATNQSTDDEVADDATNQSTDDEVAAVAQEAVVLVRRLQVLLSRLNKARKAPETLETLEAGEAKAHSQHPPIQGALSDIASDNAQDDTLGAVFAVPPKELRHLRPRQVYDVQTWTIHTLDTYGQPIASVEILSDHHAQLLTVFTDAPGRLLRYEIITQRLREKTGWAPDRGGLRKAIGALRLALDDYSHEHHLIRNSRGRGYTFFPEYDDHTPTTGPYTLVAL